MYLLFLDLLGVKARWAKGHVEAKVALQAFDDFILAGFNESGITPRGGGIDSDAAGFVFDDICDAVKVARAVYLAAFTSGDPLSDQRWWIRGVVISTSTAVTRTPAPLPKPFDHLSRNIYVPAVMDAVCVEASGRLKGMRILIDSSLVDEPLRKQFAIRTNHGNLIPFRRLDQTVYPDGKWQDYLWMVPADPDDWDQIDSIARNRMRASGPCSAELEQAAHTRVVFDQVGAILAKKHFQGR